MLTRHRCSVVRQAPATRGGWLSHRSEEADHIRHARDAHAVASLSKSSGAERSLRVVEKESGLASLLRSVVRSRWWGAIAWLVNAAQLSWSYEAGLIFVGHRTGRGIAGSTLLTCPTVIGGEITASPRINPHWPILKIHKSHTRLESHQQQTSPPRRSIFIDHHHPFSLLWSSRSLPPQALSVPVSRYRPQPFSRRDTSASPAAR